MFYMIMKRRCGSNRLGFHGCNMVIAIQNFSMVQQPKGRERISLRGCVMGMGCGKKGMR